MAQKDFYRILNIDRKASLKEIKSAYRQMALKYHPDHNANDPEATEIFQQVREAYEVLSSSEQRKKFDLSYQESPSSQPPFSKTNSKGLDLRYNLFITLEEIDQGCERSIRYIRNHNSEKETVQLKVQVPKGASQHQRLKLKGYGHIKEQKKGDLFAVIHHQHHPIFRIQGLNLRINIPVSYLDVVMGNSIEIPTLKGIKNFSLPVCEFHRMEHRLQGFGLPDKTNQNRGDLIVHFFIEHPRSLGKTDPQLLERLRETWPSGEMMQQYQQILKTLKGSQK